MAIFSSKVAVRVPIESIWDYTLGAEEQTRSQKPIIFDVDDPKTLRLSATDVAMHAHRFAKTLTEVGIQPEYRVLFIYPSSIYSASFFLAVAHLVGATFIPLSANITPSELQVIFEHSKPAAIVSHPGRVDIGRALKVPGELPSPSLLCLDTTTPLPRLYSLASENDSFERKPDPRIGTQTSRTANSPCVILYTSGTSGTPKGWVYSEHTLLAALEGCAVAMKQQFATVEPTDAPPKVLCGQVAQHFSGFTAPLLFLRLSVPVYLTRDYTAKGLLARVKACGLNELRTRGSTVLDMSHLRDPTSMAALRQLRRIRAAGSPLSFNVMQDVVRMAEPTKLRVENGYGCTEIAGIATWDPQLPVDSASVGDLYAGVIAKVVSTEDGRTLPPSTPGELYVKGPATPVGYYNNAAATEELITPDGWLRTGDFGLIREDGRVFILDRLKDLIKVRGCHVSASELEDLIMTNPNITDAAVIGVAVNNDEGPRAYVVPAEGNDIQADDVAKFVADRVPPAKQLSGAVKIVPKLPRSEAGKVLRRDLRQWAVNELGEANGNYHAESHTVHDLSRNYSAAIQCLNSLPSNAATIQRFLRQGKSSHLSIQLWVKVLGFEIDRLDSLRAIHLAGTKGKGSTAAMLESILLEYNRSSNTTKPLRVGVYTSPHIEFVRERIRIDGAPISEGDFAEAFFRLWDLVQAVDKQDRPFLSFFTFLTLLAFRVFLDKGIDCAIIETGIGGLKDPTNILPHPHVTAITRLDLDHVGLLGQTIGEIAYHKGGIFKHSATALTMEQEPEGISRLQSSAEAANVALKISLPLHKNHRALMGIPGDHQLANAGLAVDIAQAWLLKNAPRAAIPAPPQEGTLPIFVQKGLRQATWPGRSDLQLTKDVAFFIDGAHTSESIRCAATWYAEALLNRARSRSPYARTALIFNRTEDNKHELLRVLHTTLRSLQHPQVEAADAPPPPLFDLVVFCTNALTPQIQAPPDLVSLNPVPERDTTQQEDLARAWRALDSGSDSGAGKCEVRVVFSVAEAMVLVGMPPSGREMKRDSKLEGGGESGGDGGSGGGQQQHTACLVTGSLKLVGPCLTVLRRGAGEGV